MMVTSKKLVLLLGICLSLSWTNATFSSEHSVVPCKTAWKKIIPSNKHIYSTPKIQEEFSGNQNQSYQNYYESLNRKDCLKDWTILVYMQADNDLTPYAFWDLYEMESSFSKRLTGSTVKTDLLVQLDTSYTRQIRRLHIFQGTKSYNKDLVYDDFAKMDESDIDSPTIELIDETSEATRPQSKDFTSFINWAMDHYPSKNYMVVIWGHGQGWSASSAVQFGGVAFDDSEKSRLNIPDIVSALKDKNVNIVTADACLMQTVEVAAEMAPVTDYIIGSTQVHNYLGLPYRRILYELNSGSFLGLKSKLATDDEAYVMSKMIPQLFKKSFDPRFGLQGRIDPDGIKSLTMSSISSWQLENVLIPELNNLGKSLLEYAKKDPFRAKMLKIKIEKMPRFLGGSRDLGTLLGHIKEFVLDANKLSKRQRDLGQQVDRTLEALKLSLMEYSYGIDYQSFYEVSPYFVSFFKAFGIWMPINKKNYNTYGPQFKQTRLYSQGLAQKWFKWLDSLYTPVSGSGSLPFPPPFSIAGEEQ